jgi:DNA recombination protein RmuC
MEYILILLLIILIVLILLLLWRSAANKSGTVANGELGAVQTDKAVLTEKLNQALLQLQERKEEINILQQSMSESVANEKQLFRENTELTTELKSLRENMEELRRKEKHLHTQLEESKVEVAAARECLSGERQVNESLREKLDSQTKALEDIGSKFSLQFELLANKIMEEKSQKFSQLNKDNIEKILQPLGQELGAFKKKVEETYDKESKERFSLEEKVKELVTLNQQISEEAKNLTRALKGNAKTQGNWGEAILETILQNSGLEKNRHYFLQEFLKDASGEYLLGPNGKKMQPDVTITYPDDRKVIIDSKVSLVAYEQYFSSDDTEIQKVALNAHLRSIKTHIDQLSAKQYDGYDKVLDFVIMFIPMEAAYITAVQADPSLWEYAYKKRILLISSSNLIAALKMIKDLWVRTDQTKNAIEIADRGGKLYDKFVNFISSLEDIGTHLDKSQSAYHAAMKQLKTGNGNLIGQVEKLKKLGIKTSSSIPEKALKEL